MTRGCRIALAFVGVTASLGSARSQTMPASITAPGATQILSAHAEGAQIYDCATGAAGSPAAWRFREPIATLIIDGKTVGRHYAGPGWELAAGSSVRGKVVGNAPGRTAADIPWLKLEIVAHEGAGALADAKFIQRIDTKGGMLDGACAPAGAFRAEPYAATYIFLK